MKRVILHCDLNNFYASVECLYHPELRDKPVAVCGSIEDRHGIVLAKNYADKKIQSKNGRDGMGGKKQVPGAGCGKSQSFFVLQVFKICPPNLRILHRQSGILWIGRMLA